MLPCRYEWPCRYGCLLAALFFLVPFAGLADVATPAVERKISVVTALLPPSGHGSPRGQHLTGAQLRIEAFGGCYQWVSQRPDLIQIDVPQPLEPRAQGEAPLCQPVAVLRSIAQDIEGTVKVIVSARDVSAPSVTLNCEVYISRIARIDVETTLRHINVGDVETLRIRAYDAQSNVFSSLEGLVFQWQIGDLSILRPLAVADTEFQLSPARHALVLQGVQTDMLLVHGIATGRVSVAALLPGQTGGNLQAPSIDLFVKEHLTIVPASCRVPPMARIQMHVKVIHGRRQPLDLQREVELPVPYLHWDWHPLEGGSDVLVVRPDTGVVVAQRTGSGIVTVQDSRIENNTAAAQIAVVPPAKLRAIPMLVGHVDRGEALWDSIPHLRLDSEMQSHDMPWPEHQWFFVKGHVYLFKLELLDSSSKILYNPMNFRIDVDFRADADGDGVQTPSPLTMVKKTANSVMFVVQATAVGSGTVSYRNAYIQHEGIPSTDSNARTRWPELTLIQNFKVFERVRFISPFQGPLLLPQAHSYTLQVKGGSNGYAYTIRNAVPSGVVTVSSDGVVQAASNIGSAELVVADRRNLANNVSLQVLVRRVGALVLKPPRMHIQMPTVCPQASSETAINGSADTGSGLDGTCIPGDARLPVPVFAQPELTAGDDPAWRKLHFWSCNALPGVIRGQTSNQVVAEVEASGAGVFSAPVPGICGVISVKPRRPGSFEVSATLDRAADGKDLSVSAKLEVYAPLALKYDLGADSAAIDHVHIMPCSSATLRLFGGPGPMLVPGRNFTNMTATTEGMHFRVRQIPGRGFEVVCLRPTPGKVRLIAEVRHEPHDQEAHGSHVAARASAFLSCSVPSAVHIVPVQAGLGSLPGDLRSQRDGLQLGLRQGQVHQFSVHFSDSNGQPLDNSTFTPDWSVDSMKMRDWLSADVSKRAVVTVPSGSDVIGMSLGLQVVATALSAKVCAATHDLDVQDSAALREGMAELATPLRDTLQLRVTADFLVRWPGYPSRHFAFSPLWVFTFEASHGSGIARLAFNDSLVRCREHHLGGMAAPVEEDCVTRSSNIAEVVDPASICGTGMNCFKALPAKPSTAGATKWFMHPLKPGYVQVVVQDVKHLGFLPEVTEISFLPVGRIVLGLSKMAGDVMKESVLLIIRGVRHHLNIDVFDSAGHKLDPDNWSPLGLRVNQSDPRLSVEWMPEIRTYSVVGTSLGIFELQVVAYNHPGTPVFSNVLRVNVFEQFGIAPRTAVVHPGQTFEFTLQGGPAAGAAQSARVEFSSSSTSVAHVRGNDGHLLAVSPGSSRISARLVESETGRELAKVFADVEVVVPDNVSIELIESGNDVTRVEQEHPVVLVQDSCDPLRFVASLRGRGLVLTKSLLTVPLGATEQRAGSDHGCRFSWSSSDRTVMITPVGSAFGSSLDALGAAAVDVLAGDSLDGKAEEKIILTVKVRCPNSKELIAQRQLPVMRRLELRSPVLDTKRGSMAFLQVPQFGRIPLAFSRTHGHLQVTMLNPGTPALAELADHGASIELLTGAREGDVQVGVRDVREGGRVPTLTVTAAVRTPRSVRVVPRLRQLLLHATAECRIMLAGADGMPMALSTNHVVEHSISHSSVLASQLIRNSENEAVLRLRGTKEGCSAVNITVQVYRASEASRGSPVKVSLGEMMLLCVTPGVLVGKSPLLLHQGAAVHLSADTAALGSPDKQRSALSFSVRLLQVPGGQSALTRIGSQIASDLSKLLSLPERSVSVKEVHWSPYDQKADSIASGPDIDFEVDVKALKPGTGFIDIAESLWFHPELRSVSSPLRFLDLRHGVQAPLGSLAGKLGKHSRCTRQLEGKLCGGREGWVSSAPAVLAIAGPLGDAFAKQSGSATARLCFDGVSAEADFVVSRVGEIQTEVVPGGPVSSLAGNARTVASNKIGEGATPLVVFLRFFTAAGSGASIKTRELLSGPFYSHNVIFDCEPVEAVFRDFFDFDEWSLANVSSIDSLLPSTGEGAPTVRGPGAPQAACILRPKILDVGRWKQVKPPSTLRLRISILHATVQTTVDLPFVPQFAIIDGAGKQVSSGGVAAVLSLAEPMARLSIWTGGHPVEASLVKQLQDSRRGSLALHLSDPGYVRSSAELTATIVWESSRAWGGAEEVDVRLESRATGQVEIIRIRVDGSGSAAPSQGTVTVVDSPVPRGGNLRLLLLLLVLALAGWWCVGPMFTHPQQIAGTPMPPPSAPPPTEPPVSVFAPAGMAGGAYTRGSFSQSPFQRVDMRYY